MQESQPGERAYVVGHGRDAFAELLELLDRAARHPRRGLLAHGVNQHFGRVERQNAVGLVAVAQERARHGCPDQQRHDRMTRQARARVGVHRPRAREVDAEELLAPAVGLAGDVHQGDDGASPRAFVLRHRAAHLARQRPGLIQSDFSLACARKAVGRIGHDGDESRALLGERRVRKPHRTRARRKQPGLPGEGLEPHEPAL